MKGCPRELSTTSPCHFPVLRKESCVGPCPDPPPMARYSAEQRLVTSESSHATHFACFPVHSCMTTAAYYQLEGNALAILLNSRQRTEDQACLANPAAYCRRACTLVQDWFFWADKRDYVRVPIAYVIGQDEHRCWIGWRRMPLYACSTDLSRNGLRHAEPVQNLLALLSCGTTPLWCAQDFQHRYREHVALSCRDV